MPKSAAQKLTANNSSSKAKPPAKLQQQDPIPSRVLGNQENVFPGMAKATQNQGVIDTRQQASDSVNSANGPNTGENAVNRKKQKRRQKQAARLAAEQPQIPRSGSAQGHLADNHLHYQRPTNGQAPAQTAIPPNGYDYSTSGFDDHEEYEPGEGEDLYYTDEEGRLYPGPYVPAQPPANGHLAKDYGPPESSTSKAKKKKKINQPRSTSQHKYQSAYSAANTIPFSPPLGLQSPPPPPPLPSLSTTALHSAHTISKDRIWNTSTAEERERIKEFWLSLGEEERRSLVKVEKEAVLKKMKEQQKHSCSCTVCGRKRTAIEAELEVLYDAYYVELEQYANHQQTTLDDGIPMMPPPRMYPHSMARMPPDRIPPLLNTQRSSRGRIQELPEGDEDGDEEEYSEEDDDEDYSDEEPEEEPRGPAADFFNFGNSLTVQGGILTVADDLLKNDGKRFIEMMEQLAERRMQREEEAQYAAAGLGHPSMQGHNHGPPLDDEDYEDDDDEEYDSQEDDEYEDDEMEAMTEEQRMEEGRRMFQIFAARMFEQRVLTAYREKVAAERQQKLIEELEEESRLDIQREAKRAKEAQKKKDKKRQQKHAKEEEKARRDAEKAAEEAAARAIEEQKLEEQRQKKEEQRRKKEAEKKAQDEERQKKEAEKQKRLQEAREQQAEQERKQREQKEREKRKREETRRKERDEAEIKEREAKERKEREAAEKREREAKTRAEKEVKDRARKEESTSTHAAPSASNVPPSLKRNTNVSATPLPPGLNNPVTSSDHASPHLQIATPVIPKAPTPGRARKTSFQGSHSSSPKVSQPPSGSSTTSPSVPTPHQYDMVPASFPGKFTTQNPQLQHPQPTSAIPLVNTPSGIAAQPFPGFPNMPPMAGNGYPSSHGPLLPGMVQRAPFGHEAPMFPPQHPSAGPHYRGFMAPSTMPFPSGVNPPRQLPQGRGLPIEPLNTTSHQTPSSTSSANTPVQYGMPRDTMPSHSHSRQTSMSFEKTSFETASFPAQSQPIARPAPIQRPSSVKPNNSDIDDLSNHLGSSALLDGTDLPLSSSVDGGRRGSMVPGSARHGFGASQLFPEHVGSAKMDGFPRGVQAAGGSSWGAPPIPFGSPGMSGPPSWSTAPGAGWSANNAFGIIGGPNRLSASRPVTIRLLVTQACRQLTASNLNKVENGFHNVETVLRQVEQLKAANEGPIQLKEMLDICDTEGNAQNGGGSFTVRIEGSRGTFVKFEADDNVSINSRGVAAPGEIGSPLVGSSLPAFGGTRPFQPPGAGITSSSGF